VINNVDCTLLITLAVNCDQQLSAVEPMIHIVLYDRSMEGSINHWPRSVRPSVSPLYMATRDTSRSQIFPSAFRTLFYYSGWSQIVQVI